MDADARARKWAGWQDAVRRTRSNRRKRIVNDTWQKAVVSRRGIYRRLQSRMICPD